MYCVGNSRFVMYSVPWQPAPLLGTRGQLLFNMSSELQLAAVFWGKASGVPILVDKMMAMMTP